MNSEYIPVVLLSATFGVAVCWAFMRWQGGQQSERVRQLESANRDLERQAHLVEREHAQENTRLEAQHAEAIKRERAAAFEEGRQRGQTEGDVDRLRERSQRESEFEERLRRECKRSADEAREQARMQFEQQQKLFSVEVRPYFEICEVGTYFKTKFEKRVGYQYQLLVNGIPALQPHVITESKEVVEKTKDETIDKLANQALQAAQQLAQGAIDTYLGGAGTFVKLGKAIKRLPGVGK